jgi:hypothetical protein
VKPHHRVWLNEHGTLPDWKGKREVIHHKNGDHSDNRIENLEVMTQDDHMRLHWSESGNPAHKPEVIAKKRISLRGNKNALGAVRSPETLNRLSKALKGKGVGNTNASGKRSEQALANIRAGVARKMASRRNSDAR